MSELVEKLRAYGGHPTVQAAADHIEMLEAALRVIARKEKMDAVAATAMRAIAKSALENA